MSTEDKETPQSGDEPAEVVVPAPAPEAPGDDPPPEEAASEGTPSSPPVSPGASEGTPPSPEEPSSDSENKPVPEKSVGVVLSDGKVAEFDPRALDLSVGDSVVVDNDRDLNLGKVVFLGNNRNRKPLRRVIRRVGPEDLLLIRRNKKREEEAFEICNQRIAERNLPMKLIQVAYLHGGNKAIFYFSADGRVDFRALVRDLAQQLHVRIEMRQIGVRDESKMLGGLGICGQQLCCARFLRKFVPVSIKMAKNQNLALNPQKLSGLCGRLMCCLVYEDDLYRKLRKDMPKVGSTIETPRGPGKVVNADILGRRMQLQMEQGVVEMTLAELRGEAPPPPKNEPRDLPVPPRESRPEPRQSEEAEKPREGKRRRRRKPRSRQARSAAAESAKPKTKTAAQNQAGAQAGAPAPAGADGKKKRKRRSRRRSRRRKKKSPGEGGSGSGPAPTG